MEATHQSQFAKAQYELVKGSRSVFLTYCKTITPNDFVDQNTSFGRGGSMRNLLVHIANTYQYWIDNISLGKNVIYFEYESQKDIEDVIRLFDIVDNFMLEFFLIMENSNKKIEFEINGKSLSATSFELFSHVITHEFHHKGQILSISRHLGYLPVDTDIMR
jgi:uncharacterized damage-inducible protein DinB